ncbi:MAG TPA: thioesterase family protein [Acidimicrobiia bacterium]|nr:thioesterase family protein [Acidimicrobiia bacterium]
MGDLGTDTAVRGGDGVYEATLSREWEIWGPMGGYVAATALRAAGAHTRFGRPASLVAHYLGVAAFGTITLTATTLRAAKKAESVRVSVAQGDRPILEVLVWAVADDLPELAHEVSPLPDGAGVPLDHPTVEERLAAAGRAGEDTYRFWQNFESRPLAWVDDWETREPGDPVWQSWLRFLPDPDTSDPWIDAARLTILLDVGSWPAVVRHHVDPGGLYAPSIDLACHFHRLCPQSAYLFARGTSPSGAEGLVTSHQSVWADDGTFLASGISQLLCRPVSPA